MRNNKLVLINLIFICAAIALLALSFFSYQRMNRQVRAADQVSQTQLLKFRLNDAFSHLLKAETAQRGFLLTRDSIFIHDYVIAREQIPKLLSEINELISNDTLQQKTSTTIAALFSTRLKYIQNTMMVHTEITRQQLDSILVRGRQITEQLSNKIDQMIATEDQLLTYRTRVKQNIERSTSIGILLFSFLSISILVVGFFRVKKEMLDKSVLQEKVNERTEEIRITNEILHKQNIELRQINEELRSFTYVANHDLREPLRKIELFTTRLHDQRNMDAAENLRLLSRTIECVRRMRSLLDGIFSYTVTAQNIQFEPTDLNKVMETSVATLKEIIDEKGAVIECDALPRIDAIPLQMEQLFTNLLSNSLKYSKKDLKPYIQIKAVTEENTKGSLCKISIIDNGIGFNDTYREKIFDLFQRLHSKNEYEGTGVGLTICRKIAENHSGTIRANAKAGDGAVFTLHLPQNQM